MEVSGQLHTPDASPRYPLNMRLGEPQSRSRNCGEDINLALIGVRNQLYSLFNK
jgi:hypothetical protein